jgi:hypothetical protein
MCASPDLLAPRELIRTIRCLGGKGSGVYLSFARTDMFNRVSIGPTRAENPNEGTP